MRKPTVRITEKYTLAANSITPAIEIHEHEFLTAEGRMACVLVEKWGMVSVKEDGEDSAGRAKFGLLSPAETVERAIETTKALFAQIEANGWNVAVPSVDEAIDILKSRAVE